MEQSYGGDATVKAHGSATSISVKLDQAATPITLAPVQPSMLGQAIRFLVEGIRTVRDLGGKLTGKWEARTESQKNRDRRRGKLKAYLDGLPTATEHRTAEIVAAMNAAVRETTKTLHREVKQCFAQAFGGPGKVREDIDRYRSQADGSVLPPALLYTATRMLAASLRKKRSRKKQVP